MGDGRGDSQAVWHAFVGELFDGVCILDVGAGFGHSKARLARGGANRVTTADPERTRKGAVDRIAELRDLAGPWDLVTAFDVIEHAADPSRFVRELVALAPRAFVTTINARYAPHPWHWTPADFLGLVEGATTGELRYFVRHKGSDFDRVSEVDRAALLAGDAYEVGLLITRARP